ncbi:hypothetical protein CEXT_118851 [Caerostris extrusa]|uniref:Uncharacterized protein n=1 Tax=Caerostris extrusa TaxID=172846 RepID=A0AAV4RMH0_CAEEX|nr:hypothetical protein CEXT_118851 [Caerostris extrusa]
MNMGGFHQFSIIYVRVFPKQAEGFPCTWGRVIYQKSEYFLKAKINSGVRFTQTASSIFENIYSIILPKSGDMDRWLCDRVDSFGKQI